MKKLNKYTLLSLIMMMLLWSACEDEVLVPVEDTTKADQLIKEIDSAESSIRGYEDIVIEFNEEENAIRIENNALSAKYDSLDNLLDSLYNVDTYIEDPDITYTVNVTSAAHSISNNWRFSGYIDAEVTLTQGGRTETVSTSNGQAIFADVDNGSIQVRIKADGWTEVKYDAYIYDPQGASNYNASTSVSLYPLTKDNGALSVSGMAYANMSTLNDTLNRVYPSTAGASLEGTFIAEPNNWTSSTNFTQWYDYEYTRSIYDYVSGDEVNFETLPEGLRIYAVPNINDDFGLSDSGSGDVSSITYFGLIQVAEVQTDGSYELVIPVGYDDDYSTNIYIEEDDLEYLDHERLIDESSDIDRSELVDFTYYNNSESDDFVYDGGTDGLPTSGTYETVASGETLAIKRAKVTETWEYRPYFTDPSGGYQSNSIGLGSNGETSSETSLNINIYAFPINFVSE